MSSSSRANHAVTAGFWQVQAIIELTMSDMVRHFTASPLLKPLYSVWPFEYERQHIGEDAAKRLDDARAADNARRRVGGQFVAFRSAVVAVAGFDERRRVAGQLLDAGQA